MTTYAEITQRLDALVHRNLSGASLLEHREIERDSTESAYIVLWVRTWSDGEQEWGTHRALLSERDSAAALVWGHYYMQDESAAREDYLER
jgi:hypothetical protein